MTLRMVGKEHVIMKLNGLLQLRIVIKHIAYNYDVLSCDSGDPRTTTVLFFQHLSALL